MADISFISIVMVTVVVPPEGRYTGFGVNPTTLFNPEFATILLIVSSGPSLLTKFNVMFTYNQNVIKEALRLMQEHENPKLFVVGEFGRHYFTSRNIPIEQSFLYTAQNPTIHRAREISAILLDLFNRQKLSKIFVIYTDMQGVINSQACSARLLPFHRAQFITSDIHEKEIIIPFEFQPSIEKVLDNIVPSYVTGFIYSALIDSFCSEQNARMNAMDSANRNAQELLDELSVQYNHIRQGAITQEITEVSSGAKSMRKKAKMKSVRGGVKSE